MTKQLKLSAVLIVLLASAIVFADHDIYSGYTTTSMTDGRNVKNSYDECWQNSFLETKSPECGGGQIEAVEAVEAVSDPKFEDSVISVDNDFLFGFSKSSLSPQAHEVLNSIIASIAEDSVRVESIVAEGHTDFMGKETYNQALSERRANAVKDYLINHGVSAEIISAVGYGKSQARMTEQCKVEVAGIKQTSKRRLAQIACIAPDRRVDIKVRATKRVEVNQH